MLFEVNVHTYTALIHASGRAGSQSAMAALDTLLLQPLVWAVGSVLSQHVLHTFASLYQVFRSLDILRRSQKAVTQDSRVPVWSDSWLSG